jgi:hypothetical protein
MNKLNDSNLKSLAAHISAELYFCKKRLHIYYRGSEIYLSQKVDCSEKLLITAHPRETEAEIYKKLVQACADRVNGAKIKSSLEESLPVMREFVEW